MACGWTFDNDNYELKFSFAAHQGCIRCVATNSHVEDAQPLLLTGGDDEVIRAFSLSSFRQLGNYQNTRARSRTCVFVAASTLPASADGTILLWRLKEWTCVHVLGGHDKPVHSVDAHPSGRMLLSDGRGPDVEALGSGRR